MQKVEASRTGTSIGNIRPRNIAFEKMRPAQSAPNGVMRLRRQGSAALSRSYQSNLEVIAEYKGKTSVGDQTLKKFKVETSSTKNFTHPNKVNFY